MSDPTVSQLVEQLILEKQQIQDFYRYQLAFSARTIACLMGRYKTKTITAEQFSGAANDVVNFELTEDAGWVLTKAKKPAE